MKKLSLLIVVLGLLGMSEVTFAKDAGSVEAITGRDGETCSIMPNEIGTPVKDEIAAGKAAAELEGEKEREVPVEEK